MSLDPDFRHRFGLGASVLAVLVLVTWLFAPGFQGFWLGDDFGHLHQTFHWAQDGELWSQTWTKFAAPADAVGNFYRPLIFVTLSANFAMFGTNYAGWFLTNMLLHVACALLLMWVVRRAAARLDLDAGAAAPLAALVFAAAPLLVEGVMWVSARSDLAVTAMALLAAGLWLAPARTTRRRFDPIWLIPLLVLAGLGFKESAAVLPLQLLLLALVQPRRIDRSAWLALAASACVVVVFLTGRAWWFDSAWNAYADGAERDLGDALRSLPQWWRGTVASAPLAASTWLAASIAAALLASRFDRGSSLQWRLAIALAGAGSGQLLATLLNLGTFAANGEGGRLLYGPIAWFALALGVLVAGSAAEEPAGAARNRRRLATMLAMVAVVAGLVASHARVAQFAAVQEEMRDLADAIGRYASNHAGTTVLVIPDQRHGVVAARNGQGALALPPLQSTGLLHRVLPTLPEEIALRPAQFANGLGTRLATLEPQRVDASTLAMLLEPAAPGPAPAYACWSSRARAIEPAPGATPDARLCALAR